ncbi:BTB/POZ domain-containing protein KCTD19-like isoform X2 [Polyodon spathula]|uniref:BTB/POZ domain-containing protein KCTD19-like isoform X2 n=1 Tax=Polyodon spathula TaxID=7913 RepID=UPI001B7DD001|nr:BTB/POZ domain-containing protein KCTD19-like isoform X2 [Polyodon spathula]
MEGEEVSQKCFHFNVGGCLFSIPLNRLAGFQESVLWKEAFSLSRFQDSRLFIDRDGCTFRHLHYYIHTAKLASSCASEVNLLSEQASVLNLTSLLEALENFKTGKHYLRARPVDAHVSERASVNYWKTRICNTKLPELIRSPVSTGLHDKAPLGLIGTPLLDTDEEVHFCFLLLDLVKKYPSLVNEDNLLWLCEEVVIIECGCSEFRFIANYLHTENILLPDKFTDYEILTNEADILGLSELIQAVKEHKQNSGIDCDYYSVNKQDTSPSSLPACASRPLYVMVLELLVKYPDSALGQLHVDSNLEGSKVYITGKGVIFQHARNWLGTSRLPLTENISELSELCKYVDKQDNAYRAMKDAIREYLISRKETAVQDSEIRSLEMRGKAWTASIENVTVYQIVKIYIGTHWYATYLKTLLKYPELLSNFKKVRWIAFGQSLYIQGDGQMFRHILNFLRVGRLLLPSEFKEWPLLCHEVEEYQISVLSEALYQCSAYRMWYKCSESGSKVSFSSGGSFDGFKEDEAEIEELKYEEQLNDFAEEYNRPQKTDGQDTLDLYRRAASPYWDCKPPTTMQSQSTKTLSYPISSTPHTSSEAVPQKRAAKYAVEPEVQSKAQLAAPLKKLVRLVENWGANTSECMSSSFPAGRSTSKGSTSLSFNTPLAHAFLGEHFPSDRGILQVLNTTGFSTCFSKQVFEEYLKRGSAMHSLADARKCRNKSKYTGVVRAPKVELRAYGDPLLQRLHHDKTCASLLTGNLLNGKMFRKSKKLRQAEKPLTCSGCIIRVEHPPVVVNPSSESFRESVIYTVNTAHSGACPHMHLDERKDLPDIAFIHFNLTYEEILYARECHRFLTGLILDSKRLEDSEEATMKIANLVNLLWNQKEIHDQVLQWIKFTLLFARRYNDCIEILLRGFCKSAVLFPDEDSTLYSLHKD